MSVFTINHFDKDTRARTGVLHLPHGDVETPVFMPVGTRGALKALTKEDAIQIGFKLILANTYHLHLRPGENIIEQAGGLHGFTQYPNNFLTDSGGFQAFSLSKLCKIDAEGITFSSHIDGSRHLFTPENVVEMQCKFNSDVQMALDVCTKYGETRQSYERAMQLTHSYASRACCAYKNFVSKGYKGVLFPIVQGGFFEDLRKESASFISSLDTEGIAIGGLSVGEDVAEFAHFVDFTANLLPLNKPRYVMGIGTPRYLLDAIKAGVDMADCVLPTRNARNGSYFTHSGMLSIKQERNKTDFSPIDSECKCKVCRTYSRAYLRHLFLSGEILGAILGSYHNLFFLNNLVAEARQAIQSDNFGKWSNDWLKRFERGN